MQYKQYEKSMLVYRGRKKNTNNSSRYQPNIDSKTQNLKSIHRTLVQKSKHQNIQGKQQANISQRHQQQRSSIMSGQQEIFQQKQKSSHVMKKPQNYGSMHNLNPYLSKSQSRQHHSVYRSGKPQSQHRKLLKNDRQSHQHTKSKHNMSVQSLIQTQKLKRKLQQKNKQKSTIQRHQNQVKKSTNHQQPQQQTIQKSVNFYINIQKLRNLKISSREKLISTNHNLNGQLSVGNGHHDKQSSSAQLHVLRQSSPYLGVSGGKKGEQKIININNNNNSNVNNNNISLNQDKRSLILKPPNNSTSKHNRSLNAMSFQRIQNPFKFLTNKKHPNIKPRLRYKTHQNQDQDEDISIGEKSQHHQRVKSHASQNNMLPSHNQNHSGKKSNFRKHQFKDKSFIQGYLKGKQLGRGGFSKVWQGFHFTSKQFYAIKQIDTTNKYQTHLTEIWFGNHFFQQGRIKPVHVNHSGSQKLLKMFEYSIVDPKAFIVYESCDGSLGNMLYDIYQQQVVGDGDTEPNQDDDKLYMIKYKHLYSQLRRNSAFLKHFIKSIAQALDLLAINKIVHSDIKTENILLKKSQHEKKYQFKLIDYGSSFLFESLKQYKLATPQYMCPQLLNYILFENKKPCYQWMLEYVKTYENISAIDVWGLGCIVVQLIHGLPLWLNNPTRILIKGRYETKKGLFAVSDRSFSKILQKQLMIVNDFEDFITNQNNSDIFIDQEIKDVLKAMLNPNPKKRIKPHEIVEKLSVV